jgi:autotransporter-associated beta strand protein
VKTEYQKQAAPMKPNQQLATCGIFLKRTLQTIQSFSAPLRLLLAIVFCVASASADNLIWDAGNTNNGPAIDPGSGAWDTDITTNINWNNGSSNVSWTQSGITTPLNSAIFNGPDAADGTYQVVVDDVAGQISVSNLTINASGYAFSGFPIDLRSPVAAFSATNLFVIADGKSVTITNNLSGTGGSEFRLGSNGAPAKVVLYGTMTGFQPRWTSTNGSVFYLAGSGTSASGTTHFDADVRMTNGTFNSGGAFVIGRRQNGSQPLNGTGSFTLDGPTTVLNQTSDYISIGRDSVWNSTLIIQNGATVNFQTGARNNNFEIGIPRPGSSGANNQSWLKMLGGTLNAGPGTDPTAFPRTIKIADGGSRAGQISVLTQSGGVINAWAGIQIGGGGTFDGGTGALTNSGGFLYVGSYGGNGIRYGTGFPPTNRVSLSGGTVGALQSWISSIPMTLDGNNGNITFQCADASANPFNISLSGALTGPGGFNKSGSGVLILTGTNNYAGATVVSNGILVVSTANLPKSGNVILDGSGAASGFPVVTNSVNNTGQNWNMTNLTFAAGTPMMSFNYGNNPLSTTIAPVQANGNLDFTVTPSIDVFGASIAVGTYPLIKYTGTLSGTPPTTLVALPPGVTAATIVNNTGNKSIDLNVTGSINNPSLKWLGGNGAWDTSTPNWTQGGGPTLYTDNGTKDVVFDDSASGTSPILITLNATLNNPKSVTANNATKAYVISGTGSIGGTEPWIVSGAGSLTLSNANTYGGGTTVVGPGQLNINYGGNGGAASSIGIGALNISGVASGAKIDNTSGHTVVLNTTPPIPINWVDDWTFVGTTNLDLGLGQVTMGNSQVILTVVSNTLTVNNSITDNGLGFQLIKAGNGALTLSNANNFSGGLTLNAGTLNVNTEGVVGSGPFRVQGGVLDNTSGADVTLSSPSSLELLSSFTFNGSGNLNLATAQIAIGNNTITLNGTNALITSGAFTGGNRSTTVNGTGKWIMAGDGANANLNLTINGGTVYFNKSSGTAQNNPVTINTNGSLVMLNPSSTQIATGTQVTLGGGLLDLNGDTESLGSLAFNSGILRNGAPSTGSALNVTGAVTLGSASCVFDVPAVDSSLTVSSATGTGGVVVTGLGLVTLTTNGYTGNTTISNGTLVLNFPTLGTNSTVTVSTNTTLGTNGILTLNFPNADTNTVAALVVGGISKPPGQYNATTDPLYITGNGNLLVLPVAPPINPLPGVILTSNLGGGNLGLAWPTNGGWILLSNSVGLTVTNSWFAIPNSTNLTNLNVVVDPTKTNVFFRLLHP